jgi:hypothetical protein
MASIAGHTFDDSPDAICTCGRTWAEIADTTEDQVGAGGIAHTMHLTKQEWEQIVAERERRSARASAIWEAVCGVAAK